MKDYSKVFTSFWTSSDIRMMSEDARMLALYLLTSPHSNMIGCFRIPDAYVCDDMQWCSERVSKGFAELSSNGFATKSSDHWCVLHNFLKWNPIENPNQGVAAARQFDQVPGVSPSKTLCAKALSKYADKVNPTVYEGFLNRSETLPEPVTVTVAVAGTVAGTVVGAAPAETLPSPKPKTRPNTLTAKDLTERHGVDAQHADDWIAVRKAKSAALTETALAGVVRESALAGITVAEAVRVSAENGWQGFRADWYANLRRPKAGSQFTNTGESREAYEQRKRDLAEGAAKILGFSTMKPVSGEVFDA